MTSRSIGLWRPLHLLTIGVALVLGACTQGESEQPVPRSSVEVILDGAARATGMASRTSPLQLVADAHVVGPRDQFRTVIHSASDGRVRMEQTPQGFVAGINDTAGWVHDPESGETSELGPMASFVRGHELHMLALLPESRLSNPRLATASPLDLEAALGIAFSLPSGDSLVIYYAAADTIPLGLRVAYTDPNVVVTWSDWVERDELKLFTQARFVQGDEVFTYDFQAVEIAALPDSLFAPPGVEGTR